MPRLSPTSSSRSDRSAPRSPPRERRPAPRPPEVRPDQPLRQIHLDFHTSPLIPDVAAEFDAEAFVTTLRRAHVDSVTVFAKCHHGMCYYPTQHGVPHPALRGRDLLGEMIEALHRNNIRAPIYTTVAWEEDAAHRFPAWRQLRADGTFAQVEKSHDGMSKVPGGWKFLDWVNPDYQDYIEAHVREISERYGTAVDGWFFDIVFFNNLAHASPSSRAFRARHGLEAEDFETFKRFEAKAQDAFGRRFTSLVRSLRRQATVFYNSGFDLFSDATVGGRVRARHVTHIEIESLPTSGFWGYYHFPRLARAVRHWGQPWLGMTGRFQRMWGDFGGIKPAPALEYDCFRTQALGGANSVGDQLPPRGTLDPAAYDLIGSVYAQCAAAEPFYADSTALPPALGVISANYPGRDTARGNRSDEAAMQMAEECHYDAALFDEADTFDRCPLLVLPDTTVITPSLKRKLARYHARGGRLLLSHEAGRDADGAWALDFLPLRFEGRTEKFPTYWRSRPEFWPQMSRSDRVCYAQGLNVRPSRHLEVLVDRVAPYFNRTDLTYSSHLHTPPVREPSAHPAVVAGPGFVYFADPIFREYRHTGNVAARDLWRRATERLIGPPMFGADLPTTVQCLPRRRGRDLLLTLLHYVPVRKALEVDVLEERMSFAGDQLHLPAAAKTVRVFSSGLTLTRDATGAFQLPLAKGRLLLEIPGFFRR